MNTTTFNTKRPVGKETNSGSQKLVLILVIAFAVAAGMFLYNNVLAPMAQEARELPRAIKEAPGKITASQEASQEQMKLTTEALEEVKTSPTLNSFVKEEMRVGITSGQPKYYALQEFDATISHNKDDYAFFVNFRGPKQIVISETPEGRKTLIFVVKTIDERSPRGYWSIVGL